jgi:glycosyltransferase involved in cell wall biosynthesis
VIEPERPEQLAQVVIEALEHPDQAAALARNGRDWVQAEFVRDVQARRMAEFLERTVEGAS